MYGKIKDKKLIQVNENGRGFYNDNDYIMLGGNRIEVLKGLGYKPIEYQEGTAEAVKEYKLKIVVTYVPEVIDNEAL